MVPDPPRPSGLQHPCAILQSEVKIVCTRILQSIAIQESAKLLQDSYGVLTLLGVRGSSAFR